MKKIVLGLLALTLSVGAFAQTNKAERKADKKEWKDKKDKDWKNKKDKMEKDLDLTDHQKQKMKAINDQFRNEMQALNNDKSLSPDARKERRKAIMDNRRRQMDEVLTPGQREKMKGYGKEMRGKMKDKHDMGKHRGHGPKMKHDKEKIASQLNLTPQQKTKFESLHADFRQKAENIRNNNSLEPAAKRTQMQQLHQQHKQAVDALLTNEQKEKMKEMQRPHKQRRPHNDITK